MEEIKLSPTFKMSKKCKICDIQIDITSNSNINVEETIARLSDEERPATKWWDFASCYVRTVKQPKKTYYYICPNCGYSKIFGCEYIGEPIKGEWYGFKID